MIPLHLWPVLPSIRGSALLQAAHRARSCRPEIPTSLPAVFLPAAWQSARAHPGQLGQRQPPEGCASAAIGAIDVDIAMGEITGPDLGLAPPHADVRLNRNLTALHVGH